jgi:hypothetical protein
MKSAAEGDQVATAELPDRLVVGASLASEEHEVDIGGEAFFDAAGAADSGGIAVKENLEHQCRVIGRHAPWFVVGGEEGRRSRLSTRSSMKAARASRA